MSAAGDDPEGGDREADAALRRLGAPPEWLRRPASASTVRAALHDAVPELADGQLTLLRCKFKRARLRAGTWVATYRLTVAGPSPDAPAQDGERALEVQAELAPPSSALADPEPGTGGPGFGSRGWSCHVPALGMTFSLPPPDDALPSVPLLTDPERARDLLETAIRASSPAYADLRVTACAPRVMRHKPGRRCTVMYEVELPQDARDRGWPRRVVAKTHDGDEGGTAYAGMRALWASDVRSTNRVAIAEPLAFVTDLKVLLQGPVPGDRTLKDLIATSLRPGAVTGTGRLIEPVRRVGRGLATIHASGAAGGDTVTWDGQVGRAREALAQLAGPVPGLGEAVGPLLERLGSMALGSPATPLVPTHRSFRPAQVLLDGSGIGFIDFDGFCQAEQGLDLALFRTTLKDLCLRALTGGDEQSLPDVEVRACLPALDELGEAFLAGYEEVGDVSRSRLAVWEALTLLQDVLDCWRKVKLEHLGRRLLLLREQMAATASLLASPAAG